MMIYLSYFQFQVQYRGIFKLPDFFTRLQSIIREKIFMSQSQCSQHEMVVQQQDGQRSSSQSRTQKHKKSLHKSSSHGGSKENGLTTLTRKFIKMIKASDGLILDIAKAAKKLNIQKRRIYDITNVLEVIGYIQKVRKNQIKWVGEISKNDFERQIQSMKQKITNIEQEERAYIEKISEIKKSISETLQQNKEQLYFTSQDLSRINSELTKDDPYMQVVFVHAPTGSQLTLWKDDDGKSNAVINSQPTNLPCTVSIPNHNTMKNLTIQKKHSLKKLKKQLRERAKTQEKIDTPSKRKSKKKKDENKPRNDSKPKGVQTQLSEVISKEKKQIRSRQKSEKRETKPRQAKIKKQRKIKEKENLQKKKKQKKIKTEENLEEKQKQSQKKKQVSIKEQQREKIKNQQSKSECSEQNEQKRIAVQEKVNLSNVVHEKRKKQEKVSESKQKKIEKLKKIRKEKKEKTEKKIIVKKLQGQRTIQRKNRRTKEQNEPQIFNYEIYEEET